MSAKRLLLSIAALHIIVGVILILTTGVHIFLQNRSLQIHSADIQTASTTEIRLSPPAHIFIKWFVDTDIESMNLTSGTWGISHDKGNYLVQSSRPGEKGNIILYGHNTRAILGNIRALTGNEIITVTTEDNKEHQYKITTMKETSPEDVSLLQPSDTELLTIYTCSGLLDSKRFIVQAIPVS